MNAEQFTPEDIDQDALDPDAFTKTLADTAAEIPPDPNQYELRGYEVAALLKDGSWRQVMCYRSSMLALSQAKTDVTWLNDRGHKTLYQLRGLLSVALPTLPQKEEPLIMEADNDVANVDTEDECPKE